MWSRTLCFVCLLAITSPLWAQTDANKVPNPSLEEPAPAEGPWHFFQDDAGQYQHAVVNGGHTGARCYKLWGRGKWAGVSFDQIPVNRDMRYVASGWIKLEGKDTTGAIKLDYFDSDRQYLGSIQLALPDLVKWTPITVVGKPDAFAKAAFVTAAAAITGDGALYVDDVSFIERKPLASEADANLLANGSCENGWDTTPAQFFTSTNAGAQPVMEWSSEQPHSWTHGLHIRSQAQWATLAHISVPYDATKTYIASAWAKVKSGDAVVKIDFFKGDRWLGEQVGEPFSGDAWSQ